MHPVLMAFLLAHAIYSIYGNFFPNQVTSGDWRLFGFSRVDEETRFLSLTL